MWKVQFQKIQQLRLSQTRAPYYGSLPNVNQIGNTSSDFQVGNSPANWSGGETIQVMRQ